MKKINALSFLLAYLMTQGIYAQDSPWFGGLYTSSNHGVSSLILGYSSALINAGVQVFTDSKIPLSNYDPYNFHYMKFEDNGEDVDFKMSNPYGFKSYDLFNNIEVGAKLGWQGPQSIIGIYFNVGYGHNQYKLRFLGEREYSKHKLHNLRTGVGIRLSPLRFLIDDHNWCPLIEAGTTYVYNFKYRGPNNNNIDQINNGMRTTYAIGAQFGSGASIMLGFEMAHYDLFNKNYTSDGGYWYPYANFKNKDMNFYLRVNYVIGEK